MLSRLFTVLLVPIAALSSTAWAEAQSMSNSHAGEGVGYRYDIAGFRGCEDRGAGIVAVFQLSHPVVLHLGNGTPVSLETLPLSQSSLKDRIAKLQSLGDPTDIEKAALSCWPANVQ